MPVPEYFVGTNESTGREVAMKIRLVDVVEGFIELEIGAEDLQRYNLIHSQPGVLYRFLDAIHDQVRLLLRISRRLTSFRIKPDVSGNVECVANQHGIAERQGLCIRRPRVHDELPVLCRGSD